MTWVLSSIPDLKSDLPEDFVLRKIAHALEFGVLALLVRAALPRRTAQSKQQPVVDLRDGYAGLAAVAYALVDELHQTFVPGRHGAATDVLIDSAGVVLALLLAVGWRRLRRR